MRLHLCGASNDRYSYSFIRGPLILGLSNARNGEIKPLVDLISSFSQHQLWSLNHRVADAN